MLFGALIIAFAASVAAFLLIWAPLQESIRRSSERNRTCRTAALKVS